MAIDEKPSRNEDEYFAKQDAELRRQMREKLDSERATQQAGQGIKCPRCSATLREEQRESVKIDTCPSCGGIWLDKGELEMLTQVERGRPSGFLGSLLARK